MSDEIVKGKKREDEDEEEEEDEQEGDEDEDEKDDDDEVDTASEFRALYSDCKESETRFRELAATAEANSEPAIATIYREISGNILGLLADVIASAGQAISEAESAIEELEEDRESFLTDEDASKYQAHLQSSLKIADEMLKAIPEYASEQRAAMEAYKRATHDLVAYTKSISGSGVPEEPGTQ